jgi:hypothetical protein
MTAEQIRTLVAGTSDQLSAMILLGINAGFGPGDCASLTVEAVDLAKGEHRFARPKSEVQRRSVLWPETCSALAKIIGEPQVWSSVRDRGGQFLARQRQRSADIARVSQGLSTTRHLSGKEI